VANARGRFPLRSNWFRDRGGRRSRAELLRATPLKDPAVETIWSDFFFPSGIQFVGAITGQILDSDITLSLTNLAGGIDGAAREGDFVIVAHFNRNNTAGDQPVGVATAGYTEVADLFGDDDVNANLSVSWKRMGSTPDTSVTTENPNGRNIAIAYVLRGVDATTPLDVTATTATAINTGVANPPSITPTTEGAWVLAIGGNVSGATTELSGPQNFGWSVIRVNSGGSSPWGHLGIAALRWPGSGAVDPGEWTGVTDSATYASCSVTLALRPQQPAAGITLAADPGSFAFTGAAANLELGREVVADPGSFAFTGTDANLERGREVVADPGSFVFTGVAANLELGREVVADAGSFAFTGTAANLERGREVVADPGSYAFTGTDATLSIGGGVGLSLVADPGSYAFTGVAAGLERGREVVSDPGSFAFTGAAANLERGREVVADPGGYSFTGVAANLERGREVVADPGSFAFTGAAANLERGRVVAALFGTFTVTGTAANLEHGREVVADPGAFAFTGTAANLERGREVVADPGSFAFTGVAAGLEFGREIAAQPGSYGFTGAAADLIYVPSFARTPYSQGFILS
jgi:hypothetical protein